MNQRNQGGGPPRGPGHFDHPHDQDRYASRRHEYENMPSVTNREWGPSQAAPDNSFGQPGLGGHGDLRGREAGDSRGHREHGQGGYGQGGYGQDQGRHAQSGHGRGGSQFAQDDVLYAQGPDAPRRDQPRQSYRGRGPINYLRSDARITDDLIDRLTEDDHLDASDILVMVENGIATLTGEVPTRWMKRHA